MLQQRSHRQRLQVDRAAKRSVQQDKMSTASTLQHHENKRTTTTTMGGNDNGGGYYLKRQEHKQLVLEAKYKELHKRGGDSAVEHVMAKRRKKNCAKDRKRGGGVFPPRRLS